jgi:hypothetical protein
METTASCCGAICQRITVKPRTWFWASRISSPKARTPPGAGCQWSASTHGVAIHDGRLIVADAWHHRLLV